MHRLAPFQDNGLLAPLLFRLTVITSQPSASSAVLAAAPTASLRGCFAKDGGLSGQFSLGNPG
jgi:hypothetical protein